MAESNPFARFRRGASGDDETPLSTPWLGSGKKETAAVRKTLEEQRQMTKRPIDALEDREETVDSEVSDSEDEQQQFREQARGVVRELVQTCEDSVEVNLPPTFGQDVLSLKPHQIEGLRWLYVRWEAHLNGILADEMGVGKTAQGPEAISKRLLEDLDNMLGMDEEFGVLPSLPRRSNPIPRGKSSWDPQSTAGSVENIEHRLKGLGPHLVIVPTSLLENWRRELKQWYPELKVEVFAGSQKQRKMFIRAVKRKDPDVMGFNVLLTTYHMAVDTLGLKLQKHAPQWVYLVLDEAHGIKNIASQRFQKIAQIRADQRLLLTGTPVQNNIRELFSLLRFVMGDLFRAESAAASDAFDEEDEGGGLWGCVADMFVEEMQQRQREAAAGAGEGGEAGGEERKEEEGTKGASAGAGGSLAEGTEEVSLPDDPASVAAAELVRASGGDVRAIYFEEPVSDSDEDDDEDDEEEEEEEDEVEEVKEAEGASGRDSDTRTPQASEEPSPPASVVDHIRQLLAPFVLRRTKLDVLSSLPRKTIVQVHVPMTDLQREAYKTVREHARHATVSAQRGGTPPPSPDLLFVAGAAEGPSDSLQWSQARSYLRSGQNLSGTMGPLGASVLMNLRKVAAHPLLLRMWYSDDDVLQLAQLMHRAARAGRPKGKKRRTAAQEEEEEVVGEARPRKLGEVGWPAIDSEALEVWAEGDTELVELAEDLLLHSDMELHAMCEASEEPAVQARALPPEALFESGKVAFLRRLLRELRKGGHRLLLFSQFTSVLDVLEHVLAAMDVAFVRMDGGTPAADRQGLIDEFAEGDYPVFLLSTRAGGVGLNLTAADTVLLWDPDFNPHNDKQAEDRCHRIGQSKAVTVLKLAVSETVEQRVMAIAHSKERLKDALLEKEAVGGKPKQRHAMREKLLEEQVLREELGIEEDDE